ncbi:MAG: methyl-accepting chemotaxis protein [Gemmatimonadetes bacterium]|nr:methyl-accepting chemotaxis protein [Gemmatimonadota bacterium]
MARHFQRNRQRFLLMGAGVAIAVVIALAWAASARTSAMLRRQADERGRDVATRVAALVTQYLRERRREAEILAASPTVVAAARRATEDAARRRLDQLDVPSLERLFAQRRMLGGDPDLRDYLRGYPQRSDFVEVFFTEGHGFTVLASGITSDFVQADEGWWRQAVAEGTFEGEPAFDSSAAAVSLEYDVAIRTPRVLRPVGVLKSVFALDRISRLLAASDPGGNTRLQVVDNQGRLIVTPDHGELLQPLSEGDQIPRQDRPTTSQVRTTAGEEVVVAVPANNGKWWVLFRQPAASAYAAARALQRSIWIGAVVLLVFTLGMLAGLAAWLNQRVTQPVKAAGAIASRVAGGDLSVSVATERAETAEVGELLSSVHSMVLALRKLVGAIRSAADEAAAMAAEISASTQEMSASTEEMASTCQELSRRAGEQAQLVRAAADDAARILQIATILAQGADESARRNADLSTMARGHKEALDQSAAQLARLAEEVEKGAEEADALAQASTEIQKFVTQAKTVATQTNMLALNAAIEAARAGQQGRGFAVVADEVRKLASLAAASAGDTADTVRGVLARVQATRARLVRLAQGGAAAREAAQLAAQGLATLAGEAEANDAWSREIAKSAGEARKLVEEIAARLAQVAQGTDGLLASAEEIAASSEEQSASTQEIASSANQLATAADNLTGAVKTFRLLADEQEARRQAAD